MTKAELVALITHQTGVENGSGGRCGSIYEKHKGDDDRRRRCVLAGVRQFHRQREGRKSGSQHHEEHDDGYSSPFHPRLQAIQSISGGSKRGE